MRQITIIKNTNKTSEQKAEDIIDFSKESHDEARDNLLKLLEEDKLKQLVDLD